VLGVSRAGDYGWRRRSPSRRALADDRLARLIARVFKESHQTYGAPRIQAELVDDHGRGVGRSASPG
jgi:putative transposase